MIIINYTPFDYMQKIFLIKNDTVASVFDVTVSQLPKAVFALVEKEKEKDIFISGGVHYLDSLRKQVQEEEIKKYGTKTINIEVFKGEKYV